MTSTKDNRSIAALSSSICSIASAIIINPLEVAKIRQQAENKANFTRLMYNILKKEGVMTFYNGFSYTLMTNGISIGVYLFIYDACKLFIENHYKHFSNNHNVLLPLINSSVSRFISSTLFFPFECFKTKKQSLQGFNWINFNELVRQQGFKAYTITLQRDIFLAQIYWVCAENLKNYLKESSLSSTVKNIIIGGSSGVISSIVTLPFDVIKTNKQTKIEYQNSSYFQISQDIYMKNNGIKGFFLGIQPRVLKVTIHGAILISSYEYVYKRVHRAIYNA